MPKVATSKNNLIAEDWQPEDSTESTAGGKTDASRQPTSKSGKSKSAEKSKAVATDTKTFTELEVGESAVAGTHPAFAGIVGCDVGVLPASFPNEAAPKSGMIGWRGKVTAKRGAKRERATSRSTSLVPAGLPCMIVIALSR